MYEFWGVHKCSVCGSLSTGFVAFARRDMELTEHSGPGVLLLRLQHTHKTTFRKHLTLGGSVLTAGTKQNKMVQLRG